MSRWRKLLIALVLAFVLVGPLPARAQVPAKKPSQHRGKKQKPASRPTRRAKRICVPRAPAGRSGMKQRKSPRDLEVIRNIELLESFWLLQVLDLFVGVRRR